MTQQRSSAQEEFSLAGPRISPPLMWSFTDAMDLADELELSDRDWEVLNTIYTLTEDL